MIPRLMRSTAVLSPWTSLLAVVPAALIGAPANAQACDPPTMIPQRVYDFGVSGAWNGSPCSVIYQYTAPASGTLVASTCGGAGDRALLTVSEGAADNPPLAVTPEPCAGQAQMAVSVHVTEGSTYYLVLQPDPGSPNATWTLTLSLPSPVALSGSFNITSEAAFFAWKDALRAAEYVREDFITGSVPSACPTEGGPVTEAATPGSKPRVLAVVAAAMAFLDRNPFVTTLQLESFTDAYDAALRVAAPGDPNLVRRANLLRALRNSRVVPTTTNRPELLGTDTDIGEAGLLLLDLEVPRPIDFFTLQDRTALYERASLVALAQGPEVAMLLTHAFLGQGPNGEAVAADVSAVLQAFLFMEGYDPRLGSIRPELCGVNAGINTLPADYLSYLAGISAGVDRNSPDGLGNPFQQQIGLAFSADLSVASDIVTDIATTPQRTMLQALAASQAERDAAQATLLNRLRSLSASRTAMFANTMAMAQSVSVAAGDFEYIRAQTQASKASQKLGSDLAYAEGSLGVAIGVAGVGAGFLTGNPATALQGLSALSSGAFGVAGASSTVSNDQLSEQINMLSQQLGDVQDQLNDRFDRVDARLAALITLSASGFDYLGTQIANLSQQVEIVQADLDAVRATLDTLAYDLWVQSTSLRRIEDALFGVAQNLLSQDFIDAVFDVINYRAFEIIDLAYSGPAPSFRSGANDIFQYATVDAATPAFSGSRSSPFPVADADAYLGDTPVARVLNDLSVNAAAFGVPQLTTQTVVAPEPWGQALTGYIELARENPWYYTYLLTAEQATPGATPQISRMIADGEAMVRVGENARNATLFRNLVADYKARTAALQTAVDALVRETLRTATPVPLGTPDGGNVLNLWMDVSTPEGVQDVGPFANSITAMTGPSALSIQNVLGDEGFAIATGFNWANEAQLRSLLLAFENNGNYRGISWSTVNSFADDIVIRLAEPRLAASTNDGFRTVRFSIYEAPPNSSNFQFSNTYANNPTGAIQLFWNDIRFQFSLGNQLGVGFSWTVGASNQTRYQLRIISDTLLSSNASGASAQDKPALRADMHQMLFRIRNNLIRPTVRSAVATPSGSTFQQSVYNAAQALNDSQAILAAYANLAVPYEIDVSEVLQAAFRGNAATSDLGLRSDALPAIIDAMSVEDAADQSNAGDASFDVGSIATILNERVDAVNAELQFVIANREPEPSGYVAWILGEAKDLRDNAARLAVDDTFAADTIPAERNVLANDTRQSFGPLLGGLTRDIETDPTFTAGQPGYLAPTAGTVSLSRDGTFEFTPSDPAFSGTQVFSYRARCDIGTTPSSPTWAVSVPAFVVFEVAAPSACPADFNEDTVPGDIFDLFDFLAALDAGLDYNADTTAADIFDLFDFLAALDAGCP